MARIIDRSKNWCWLDLFIPKRFSYIWGGVIHVPAEYFSWNTIKQEAMKQHELSHVKSINTMGEFNFYMKYLFDKKFRYQEEVNAYEKQIKFLKDNSYPISLQWVDIMEDYGALKWISWQEALSLVTSWRENE